LSEERATYEVLINREPAIEDGFVHFWVEKLWVNSDLKVRGSQLSTGYTVFPRGQCIVKFPVENEELTPEDLAQVLDGMVSALTKPFQTFVRIEDSQERTREEDF